MMGNLMVPRCCHGYVVFTRRLIYHLVLMFGLSIVSAGVQAHAFTVLLVSSFSGVNAAIGPAVRDGFLLASAEQDAHLDETANGHLGGLDVHLLYFDIVTNNLTTQLSDRLKQGDIDIVMLPTSKQLTALIAVIEPLNMVLATLSHPVTKLTDVVCNGDNFGQHINKTFSQRFYYQPDRYVAQGYQLARAIAVAVRQFGGVANKLGLQNGLVDSRLCYSIL